MNNFYVDDDMCIKIGGFSKAVKLMNENETRKTILWECSWMAPEVIQMLTFDDSISMRGMLLSDRDKASVDSDKLR